MPAPPPHGPSPGTSGPRAVRRRATVPLDPPGPAVDAARTESLADRLAATQEAMRAAIARRVAAELHAIAQRARAGREGP